MISSFQSRHGDLAVRSKALSQLARGPLGSAGTYVSSLPVRGKGEMAIHCRIWVNPVGRPDSNNNTS